MSAQENKTKQHFHFGHLSLIAGSVAVILLISWFKGGFNFEKKLSELTKNYTYAEAEKDAANSASENSGAVTSEQENQLALLDPNFLSGSVLGAATGTTSALESVFSETATPIPREILDSIPVTTNNENNQTGIAKYMQEFSDTEYGSDAPGILIGLNSDNLAELQAVPQKVEELLKGLLIIEVPSDLADYHRLKMLYYTELRETALINLNIQKKQDAESVSQQIFSISQELSNQQAKIFKKYGITL